MKYVIGTSILILIRWNILHVTYRKKFLYKQNNLYAQQALYGKQIIALGQIVGMAKCRRSLYTTTST